MIILPSMFGLPQQASLLLPLLDSLEFGDLLVGLLLLGSLQLSLQLGLIHGSLCLPLDQLADLSVESPVEVIHGDGVRLSSWLYEALTVLNWKLWFYLFEVRDNLANYEASRVA